MRINLLPPQQSSTCATGSTASMLSLRRSLRPLAAAPWAGSPAAAAAAWRRLAASAAEGRAVLLVESPAKARKIQGYVGDDYHVLASHGHIRDLPARAGSVQPEREFEMRWELSPGGSLRVEEIARAVRAAGGRVVLATDPDREGEAISWHLAQELQARGVVPQGAAPRRITFTEVTRPAVLAALQAPRALDEALVDAYLARRALDYLFGFNLSPLLWRKLPGARSAGRVQSVALRIVAEREAAIEAFRPVQYWTVGAALALPGGAGSVEAALASVDGAPPPKPGFLSQAAADEVARRVAAAQFSVAGATSKETARSPPPPFTTSSMQQEANKRLGMGASRTMQLAQKLYEAGHITYMRTDGVAVAPAAVHALRAAAQAAHGADHVPLEPRFFAARAKNAQEAHEAVRPTDLALRPEMLRAQGFEPQAVQLYTLVLARALGSQMAAARVRQAAADFASADGALVLRATASHVAFPGYLAAYGRDASVAEDLTAGEAGGEGADAAVSPAAAQAAAAALAALQPGARVEAEGAAAEGHATRPPGRFTEGTLVKELETLGVGRPSTYAPTLKLLQARHYVRREGRALYAEPLGRVLSSFLHSYFEQYVDYGFTSALEGRLDDVSGGEAGWREVLADFWGPFQGRVQEMAGVGGKEVLDTLNAELEEMLFGAGDAAGAAGAAAAAGGGGARRGAARGRECPMCGGLLSLKLSHKGGPFVGCGAHPACSYTRDVSAAAEGLEAGDPERSARAAAALAGGLSSLEVAAKYGMRGAVRLVGVDPRSGKEVFARQGPYGIYLQLGTEADPEMRRVPLPKRMEARSVKLDYALAVMALPRQLGDHPELGDVVEVRNGKFGPFVQHADTKRSVPKSMDPIQMSLADAVALLKTAERTKATLAGKPRAVKEKLPETRGRKKKVRAAAAPAEEEEGAAARPAAAAHQGRGKVTRALSAYQIFLSESMAMPKHAVLLPGERMRTLGEAWRNLTPEQVQQYHEKSALDKTRVELQTAGLLPAGGMREFMALPEAQRGEVLELAEAQRRVVALVNEEPAHRTRPRSPYQIFMSEKGAAVTAQLTADADGTAQVRGGFIQLVADMWRTLPESSRQVYLRKAAAEAEALSKWKKRDLLRAGVAGKAPDTTETLADG